MKQGMNENREEMKQELNVVKIKIKKLKKIISWRRKNKVKKRISWRSWRRMLGLNETKNELHKDRKMQISNVATLNKYKNYKSR